MSKDVPGLTADQLAAFRNDGYCIVPKFADTDNLLERAKQLIADLSLEGHPLTKFSTGGEDKHVGDDYFLSSADRVHFFFEEDAVSDGKLNRPKERAINKFGHALHVLDPTFREFTFQPRIKRIARDLNVHRDPRVLQSMVICKQPQIGGMVPTHDDATFLYTQDGYHPCVGFWIAMEDCKLTPTDNGCLSFAPGSHKENRVATRFVRLPQGGTGFQPVPGVEPLEVDWAERAWQTHEVDAGSLVIIDGLVKHASTRNTSDRSRFIYTFHMIDGEAPYPPDNWLQSEKPFTKLFDG